MILRSAYLLLLLASVTAHGARQVNSCSQAFLKLEQVRNDSSVELEMIASEKVLQILDSVNGKLGGVIREAELPAELKAELARLFPNQAPEELAWAKIPAMVQKKLINAQVQARGQSFWQNRRIEGLRVKEKIHLVFTRETSFLGKVYPPGNHLVDVSKAMGKVEYGSTDDLQILNHVELHFRAPLPAGQASREARVFQFGLRAEQTPQHVHIVTPLPMELLRANPRLEGARLGDYFRRVNLFSEIASIFEGWPIRTIQSRDTVYFDNLTRSRLRGVTEYFVDRGNGKNPTPGDRFKMGWAGMRGSDKYDQPDLWGIEYRAVVTQRSLADEQMLDSIQWGMVHQEYGIPKETIERWLAANRNGASPVEAADAVANAWYRSDAPIDLSNLPEELKKKVDVKKLDQVFNQNTNRHERQMLFHSWENDPLFFENPAALQRIQQERDIAFEKLSAGKELTGVIQDFLWDSGIAETVGKSLRTDLSLASDTKAGFVGHAREKGLPKSSQNSFWEWFKRRK